MDLHIFVDRNHAGNKWTRKSRTRFMIFVNMSLINWYSMKQSTIETSVFGAKFAAMNIGVKTLHAIQYKLRIMGGDT